MFGLAQRVHGLIQDVDVSASVVESSPGRVSPLPVSRLLKRGGYLVASLVIQFVSLLVFGYSQWASVDFTLAETSTIAVAAAASLVATAGCVGTLGYLSTYFSESGKYRLTRRIVLITFGLGLVATAVGALALYLTGRHLVSWPPSLLRPGLAYYALFAVSTVTITILYILRQNLAMIGTSIVGVLVAVGAHEGLDVELRHAQWAGIGASIGVASGVGLVGLNRLAGWTAGLECVARLPRPWTLLRLSAPHFIFPTLYFAAVVADRIVAWSAGRDPLPVWFDTPYEIGLDWALGSVLAGVAFLEITVAAVARLLETVNDRYGADDIANLNRAFLRFWIRHTAFTLMLLVAGAAVVYGGLHALGALGMEGLSDRIHDPVTWRVFALALVGYGLLALGLSNGIFLFSMARPWLVVGAMAAALSAGLTVSVVLSRTIDYWWSAAGTAVSGFVFAALTGVAAWRTLRRGDLHLYAAY